MGKGVVTGWPVAKCGHIVESKNSPCPACNKGRECEPTCDTCGADSEAVEWCGECGNCLQHCDTEQIHGEGGE